MCLCSLHSLHCPCSTCAHDVSTGEGAVSLCAAHTCSVWGSWGQQVMLLESYPPTMQWGAMDMHAWSLACHVTVTVSYIVQNYVLQSCFTHFLLKTPARVAPTATTIIYAMYVQYIVRHVFSDYCLGCPSHCHRAQSNLCQEPRSCSVILPVVTFPEPAPLRCTHWPTRIPHHLIHTEHGQPNSVGCLGKCLCGDSACPSSIPCIC